jgi:hypothetical protein
MQQVISKHRLLLHRAPMDPAADSQAIRMQELPIAHKAMQTTTLTLHIQYSHRAAEGQQLHDEKGARSTTHSRIMLGCCCCPFKVGRGFTQCMVGILCGAKYAVRIMSCQNLCARKSKRDRLKK